MIVHDDPVTLVAAVGGMAVFIAVVAADLTQVERDRRTEAREAMVERIRQETEAAMRAAEVEARADERLERRWGH